MKKKFLKSKKSSLAIFLVFLLALNWAAGSKSWYLDLTEDQVYTASGVSRQILGELEQPVTVTFYISKELPADQVVLRTQLEDILNQYQDIARGKLTVKYETPGGDDGAASQELAAKGLRQLQSQVVAKDKIEVKNFFFGAVVAAGEGEAARTEVLPSLENLEGFEYELVSAVYSVSKQEKERIAFLTGHGEREIAALDLKKGYRVDKVAISTDTAQRGFYVVGSANQTSDATAAKELITPKTVIILAPQTALSAEELGVLDEFVAGGGKVAVLAERENIDLGENSSGFAVKKIETNIGDFTKRYGIEINDDLVYDQSNLPISYYQQTYFGMMQAYSPYPYWVAVGKDGFGNSPALSRVQSLAFLWSSSLTLKEAEGYTAEPLLSSSAKAGSATGSIDLAPTAVLAYDQVGRRVLAARAASQMGSGQVIVIGDSDFVSPSFIDPVEDNETFFLGLIDSVSSSANLSAIRSKSVATRPLRETTDAEKNSWKFFGVAGGALLLGAYGIMRLNRRRKMSRS